MTGSPMDLRWCDDNVEAIVQAWYPGAEGGTALADLLFGKSDFSGRLPLTFVKKTEDLPDFLDYSMKNRTYRYIENDPLYPFGYGLTYNDYIYSDLKLNSTTVTPGDDLELNVRVKNNTNYSGHEVVQIYLRDNEASVETPNHSLVAFESIHLEPRQEKNYFT